jgi:serine phosphatase RsbU (regulator of sigma subunit)
MSAPLTIKDVRPVSESGAPGFVLWSFARRALISFVFAGFPVLVLLASLILINRLETGRKIELITQGHSHRLQQLTLFESNYFLAERVLLETWQGLQNLDPIGRQRVAARVLGQTQGFIELFFFDRTGRLMENVSSHRLPARALELAYRSLVESARSGGRLPAMEGLLKSLFRATVMNLQHARRQTVILGSRGRDSRFLWQTVADSSDPNQRDWPVQGFFAVMHDEMVDENWAQRFVIRRLNGREKTMRFGLVETTAGQHLFYPSVIDGGTSWQRSFWQALGRYDFHWIEKNRVFSLLPRRSSGYLLVSSPLPSYFHPWLIPGLACAGGLLILFVWSRVKQIEEGFHARIPTRLLALFLFAVGIPSLLLLVGGSYALRDRGVIRQQELEQQMTEKLKQFDARFPLIWRALERRLNDRVRELRNSSSVQERQAVMQKLGQERLYTMLMLVDPQGRLQFEMTHGGKAGMDAERRKKRDFAMQICRELIKRFNGSDQVDASTLVAEASSGIFNALLGESNFTFDNLLLNLGKFVRLGIDDDYSLFYLGPVLNDEGKASEVLIGFITATELQSYYLQQYLGRVSSQPDLEWRVNACGDFSGIKRSVDSQYRQIHARFPYDHTRVVSMGTEVKRTRALIRKVLPGRSGPELWIGMKGQALDKFALLGVGALAPLHAQQRSFWFVLLATAVAIVLCTGVIGLLLAEQFLQPIADVSTGIRHIQTRDFDYRIPVRAADELGEMSSLLNNVLEGMKDLEMARVVQENLLPTAPLQVGPFRVHGRSQAMADTGGDYFDYFAGKERTLVGLIGDVSGHGVSAALVMGMAKAVFAIDENLDRGVLEMLEIFHHFLLKTVKKKKMMTLFHFRINTETGTMQSANAGQCFPLHFQAATGKVVALKILGLPLGIRKRMDCSLHECTLAPGDTLLLYTDGLIEALGGPGGNTQVNERVEHWFAECAGQGPEGVVDHLFSRFATFTEGVPPGDDVSIVCLRRDVP